MTGNVPTKATVCVALVKPGSKLAKEWKLPKPAYGIYEYEPVFERRELRWGDGSWQELSAEDHHDLVLLLEPGEPLVNALFD
ncbi:hypothetical protein [Agrobacterium sp. LAD9]|uniref:hypothetical protein n=1 Tax=Agrobacterium sp. LAD9 TaxID=2055153 RepID=UPI000D1DD285|nr:hypothetical protein [Agrobacterium sp. LAD9]